MCVYRLEQTPVVQAVGSPDKAEVREYTLSCAGLVFDVSLTL